MSDEKIVTYLDTKDVENRTRVQNKLLWNTLHGNILFSSLY